ncbi:MAG TPA: hypothetical protein DCX03_05045, partial [Bacteroidales bacterium]|nr:hypothetical protein [Bacteroidales bacterium]
MRKNMKFIAVICVVMISATSFAWQTVGGKLSCLEAGQLKTYTASVQQGDKKQADFIIDNQI